jgi:hypothetical protein
MSLVVRPPRIGELRALGELCVRSKAIWGYEQKFLDACRGELSFSAMDLKATSLAVVDNGNKLLGVAQVKVAEREADLLKLFVEPDALCCGIGKLLFSWAATVARNMDADQLLIDADPNAAPFYRRMGARDVGLVSSGSIPGRMLPRLALDLRSTSHQ